MQLNDLTPEQARELAKPRGWTVEELLGKHDDSALCGVRFVYQDRVYGFEARPIGASLDVWALVDGFNGFLREIGRPERIFRLADPGEWGRAFGILICAHEERFTKANEPCACHCSRVTSETQCFQSKPAQRSSFPAIGLYPPSILPLQCRQAHLLEHGVGLAGVMLPVRKMARKKK